MSNTRHEDTHRALLAMQESKRVWMSALDLAELLGWPGAGGRIRALKALRSLEARELIRGKYVFPGPNRMEFLYRALPAGKESKAA